MRILDHHHGGIDHRADRDRDSAERQDVGVQTLKPHDNERHEDAEREGQDRD